MIDNQGIYAGAITLATAELSLSNTIFVQNISNFSADIESKAERSNFKNKLYSWRCSFKHGNKRINSSSNNFKKMSINEQFIIETGLYTQNNFTTEETQFASN